MIEVKQTDKFFYDSADAGDPVCICSRCEKKIPEKDAPIIRCWPTGPGDYGYDAKAAGGTEFRYCRQCSESMGVFFGKDYEDEYNDDDEPEIFGYECLGCGHVQDHPGECDRCTGSAVDAMIG